MVCSTPVTSHSSSRTMTTEPGAMLSLTVSFAVDNLEPPFRWYPSLDDRPHNFRKAIRRLQCFARRRVLAFLLALPQHESQRFSEGLRCHFSVISHRVMERLKNTRLDPV